MNRAVILFNCIAVFIWAADIFVYIIRGKPVPLYIYIATASVIILFHIGFIVSALRS